MFECSSHAKWILSGEHAVLRGHPAIVFPKPDSQLKLYFSAQNMLSITWDAHDEYLHQLKKLITHLAHQKNLPIQGHLHFENTIPIGKGFGFSAALSICLAKLLIHLGLKEPVFSLAHQIEHYFHGKSSGLDIAGCLHTTPICFQDGQITPLDLKKSPNIQLIDSGISARSSLCIEKVHQLFQSNPTQAYHIDQNMKTASLMAKEALIENNIKKLSAAIDLSQTCFSDWGLVPQEINDQIEKLKADGAVSCKLSGAGLGGLIIALYD